MIDINDFKEEKSCTYKDREYLVRDNGAVLRKPKEDGRANKCDNVWMFGTVNTQKGYLDIAGVAVHRIVAYAYLGEPPTKDYIVDHIDTNRQNNRPSNLRWITKLENVVLNEASRKKIEYKIGASIFEFLERDTRYDMIANILNTENYIVTPKEVDEVISDMSKIIAKGINNAV